MDVSVELPADWSAGAVGSPAGVRAMLGAAGVCCLLTEGVNPVRVCTATDALNVPAGHTMGDVPMETKRGGTVDGVAGGIAAEGAGGFDGGGTVLSAGAACSCSI